MSSSHDQHELLSAYLAGELDAAEAAAFEQRLAAEPELAARLEVLHDALLRLQAVDEVAPPDGYGARLRDRLDAEADVPAAAAHERADEAVVDIGAERARRSGLPWAPLGAVAAGIATLAVVVAVLGPPGDDDLAAPAEDAPVAMDAPDEDVEMEAFDDGEVRDAPDVDEPAGDSAADAPAPAPAVVGPVVLDSEAPLEDEAAVRQRYTGLPEAEGLLGTPRAEAEDRAASARFAVQRSEPFASGVHPAACLDVVTTAAEGPVVVARVESALHEGADATVYVAVATGPDGRALERIEVWLVEPDTCATRLFITIS